MNDEKENLRANHFFELIQKKNVWEFESFCTILNIDSYEFSFFVKSLPMAYGLVLRANRLYITPELTIDVEVELKTNFIEWLVNTQADDFVPMKIDDYPLLVTRIKGHVREVATKRLKVSVFGVNSLVKRVLEPFYEKEHIQPKFQYIGGYEPLIFDYSSTTESIECQFSVINYNRSLISLANLLYEIPEGFLLIFDPDDKLQAGKISEVLTTIIEKRKKDLAITLIAVLDENPNVNKLQEFSKLMFSLVKELNVDSKLIVSFAISSSEMEIERKIMDFLDTAKLLMI